jgi:hypothetical protein
MNKLKVDAKHTLLDGYPMGAKRFALKLEYLLTPEQKRVYYNSVLISLSNEIENTLAKGALNY